ncbi:MAG: hypothetical protein RIQ90_1594 [Bacteroidota bacterium]|jgi:inward rectifier potassium channel
MENKNVSEEIGFGSKNYTSKSRYLNPDGSFNIQRKGKNFWENFDGYNAVITMHRTAFWGLVILGFLVINTFFALVYMWIGVEHFGNLTSTTGLNDFLQLFYFSAQTLTTVGYGHLYPKGNLAGAVATLEAAIGLMGFALATGILYARFSRPKSFLLYSKHLLVSPYKAGKGLMFRITNPKRNELIEAEAQVIVSMINQETGQRIFRPLELELTRISFLALTWTIVHPLNPESPLYQFSLEDFKKVDAEFLIFIKAIDDTYEQKIHSRHSYTFLNIIDGAKFVPLVPQANAAGKIILNVHKISDFEYVSTNP